MTEQRSAAVTTARTSEVEAERWADPVRGEIAFRTLFSADRTATTGMTAGVAELSPGGWLGTHRHPPAEIYHVLEGEGVVTLDGQERPVGPGTAVFIPGGSEHAVRNVGTTVLRIFYVLAVDAMGDVGYRFAAGAD